MLMTQDDIRSHYEQQWKTQSDGASGARDLAYSSPIEDAVAYPAYLSLLRDHNLSLDDKRVLDVGSGSGRWVSFLLEHFRPGEMVGMDYTLASVELLRKWWNGPRARCASVKPGFLHASIADPALNLDRTFDFINIANVLFHIPEPELHAAALRNLRKLLAPGGAIVTTEYLPRVSMRTNWMMVRSRYEFGQAVAEAGLRIAAIRGSCFFANDPMGLDGPDGYVRQSFNTVRDRMAQLLNGCDNDQTRRFIVDLFANIEQACLSFARERIAEVDMPSQKLVLLVAA